MTGGCKKVHPNLKESMDTDSRKLELLFMVNHLMREYHMILVTLYNVSYS